MRRLVGVVLSTVLVGFAVTAARQTQQPGIRVYITPGTGIGSVPVWTTPRYVEGPGVAVAPLKPPPQPGSPPELTFGISAWKDGDAARVVVYAVLMDKRAPSGRTNTPISTFLIAPGQSLEVKEAHSWGVFGLVVSADTK